MADETEFTGVGFFNCVGIIITLVVGFAFIFVLARTLMFIQKIIYKLRIIMKNSYIIEKACMGLPVNTNNRKEDYQDRRDVYRKEIIRSWNLRFSNVFKYVLDRYNHLIYILICRRRSKIDNLSLLKPQFSFYLMVWFLPFFIMWTLAIFIVGNDLTIEAGAAVGLSFVAGFFGSLISVVLTFWLHYFWNKNIWAAFERGSEDKMDEIEQLQRNIQVEVPGKGEDDDETKSLATNAPRVFNYKLTSRTAFLGGDSKPTKKGKNKIQNIQQTLLVPETQVTSEEQFRATFMTNFTKKTYATKLDDEEGKLQSSPQNEEAKSDTPTVAQDEPVAVYKMIRDRETLGDIKLIQQESSSIKNLQNIIFFFSLIVAI